MKMFNGSCLALGVVLGLAIPVMASATGNDSFSGVVPVINEIVVTDMGGTLDNLHTTALSGVTVTKYKVSNNYSLGFRVTFASNNLGKLIRLASDGTYVTSPTDAGNFVAYTVTTAASSADNSDASANFLGTTEAGPLTAQSLSSNVNLNYITAIVTATKDYNYLLKINTAIKPQLFRGTFKDTVTITIADTI